MNLGKKMKHKGNKDKNNPMEKIKRKVDVISNLQLPKDLMLGAVIISITGQHEAYVENYRGIIEYTEQVIRLQTKTCRVCIFGKKLEIIYFTNDEMKIVGEILEVKYYD
ncbi:hypothetical protein FACS189418_8950 [Clostridia bacterium]|nr:hypothetical protein FACS189418_8950 [Clostridia bacterium]